MKIALKLSCNISQIVGGWDSQSAVEALLHPPGCVRTVCARPIAGHPLGLAKA